MSFLSRRKRAPSVELRSVAQSSLWRLEVGEVDAADMVYAADGVALGEVDAAESCSTRRTEARCGAVDAADTGSTLWMRSL